MLQISTALANGLLATGSVRSLINTGKLYLFSGPIPADADVAIDGGSTLLGVFTESDDGTTGLTFESTAVDGVLSKTAAEDWATTFSATGTATFYRFCEGADNGEGIAGGTDNRVQGTVGPNMSYDMRLTTVAVVATESLSLDAFEIRQPQGPV